MSDSFTLTADVAKVNEDLGLVMGFAIICKRDGEPYFDVQDDHVPEDAMMAAALDFMQHSRTAKDMHSGQSAGCVVFAWPMTEEVAKAFNIVTDTTGLMIAMKPDSDELLEKFRSGEYTGFSIGGERITDEEVDDA